MPARNVVRNWDEDEWPFDLLDHEREQNGANPMRVAGTIVCLGAPPAPVRNDFPMWMSNRQNYADATPDQRRLLATDRYEYAVKADRDGKLWWFDNIIERNPFRGGGCAYRPYVHSALDLAAQDHISMAKQITMSGGSGPMVHFPCHWKVSFVPMLPHHLQCNEEGKPLVLQKHVDNDDFSWPLTLPHITEGVACEIVQDLGVHQPNKELQEGPVLSFRRNCPRLPTRVSAA